MVKSRLLALFLASLLLAGCGLTGSNSGSAESASPKSADTDLTCLDEASTSFASVPKVAPVLPSTGTSLSGQPVQITSVDRVVSLASGSGEIVWALGLGDSLVGIDLVSVFPDSENKPVVNPGHEVAIETVLSLNPTLIIADQSFNESKEVTQFEELGIPVITIPEAKSITDVAPRIDAVASALGISNSGSELNKIIDKQLSESIQANTTQVSIAFLYLRGSAGVYLLGGEGSGADKIIQAIGAKDVGTELGIQGFTPLTAEALATANPDVLLVMNKGLESVGGIEKLIALPGISSTTAGKNRAIIQADDRVLLSFGPQTAGVISCLAKQLSALTEEQS